jgi:hypothetical protein
VYEIPGCFKLLNSTLNPPNGGLEGSPECGVLFLLCISLDLCVDSMLLQFVKLSTPYYSSGNFLVECQQLCGAILVRHLLLKEIKYVGLDYGNVTRMENLEVHKKVSVGNPEGKMSISTV